MKIVSVKILKEFWDIHPDSEQHLKACVDEAKQSTWHQPADIKDRYRNASVLKTGALCLILKGTTTD